MPSRLGIALLAALIFCSPALDSAFAAAAHGTLPNGLEFACVENATPADEIVVRLRVKTGSGYEKPDQQGIAHFLEHLSFQGSADFPGPAMTSTLQSWGASVGSHLNGYTSYDETVFELRIPKAGEERTKEVLRMLRGILSGLEISAEGVERERAVVLQEMKTMDNAMIRNQLRRLGRLIREKGLAGHPTIGTEELIRRYTKEEIRAFYEQWYRPDNAELVVTGDLPLAAMERLVREIFEPVQKPDSAVAEVDVKKTKLNPADRLFVDSDPDLKLGSLWFDWLTEVEHQKLEEDVAAEVLTKILEKRLAQAALDAEANTVDVNARTSMLTEQSRHFGFMAFTNSDNWNDLIDLFARTATEIRNEGFTEEEFEAAKREVTAELDRQLQESGTKPSLDVARDTSDYMDLDADLIEPARRREKTLAALSKITVDELRGIAKRILDVDQCRITVQNSQFVPSKQLQAALHASARRHSSRSAKPPSKPFDPAAVAGGKLPGAKPLSIPGVSSFQLENGVVVNFRPLENEVVSLTVNLGDALTAETEKTRGRSDAAAFCLSQPDIGASRWSTVKSWLEERAIEYRAQSTDEGVKLLLSCAQDRIPDATRFLRALFQDFHVNEATLKRWRETELALVRVSETDLALRTMRAVRENLLPHIPQKQLLTKAQIQAATTGDVARWCERLLKNVPVEAGVAGAEASAAQIAEMLATLPAREPVAGKAIAKDESAFPGQIVQASVIAQSKGAQVLMLIPVDGGNPEEILRADVLVSLLQEELFREVREKQGLCYSINVNVSQNPVFARSNTIQMVFTCENTTAPQLDEAVRKVFARLTKEGVTDEAIAAASSRVASKLSSALEKPQMLSQVLATLSSYPVNKVLLELRTRFTQQPVVPGIEEFLQDALSRPRMVVITTTVAK